MKLTAENRAIKHHLSPGDAGRHRKEEISEQLYLFGGSTFDFPAVQDVYQEPQAGESARAVHAGVCTWQLKQSSLSWACKMVRKCLSFLLQEVNRTAGKSLPACWEARKTLFGRSQNIICDMKEHQGSYRNYEPSFACLLLPNSLVWPPKHLPFSSMPYSTMLQFLESQTHLLQQTF